MTSLRTRDLSEVEVEGVLDEESLTVGGRHARFIDPDVPYHIASRVVQGLHFLRPCRELNELIAGILGRAQERYARVQLYAAAFMSNHLHLILQGPPEEVPAFIGFVKREITLRWARRVDPYWRGPMWHDYVAIALPTLQGQLDFMKYVLSQGVKEGLVARAEEWPGVHCARSLLEDKPMRGKWFDGTGYCRALDAERRKVSPQRTAREPYYKEYAVHFATLPAWRHLESEERRVEVRRMLDEIEAEGRALGRKPLGARAVCRMPHRRRTEIPKPPWQEPRRRVVCCGPANDPDAKRYRAVYRCFQRAFAEARVVRSRQRDSAFPPGSYESGRWTPLRTSSFSP